jgi:hypothetical protein
MRAEITPIKCSKYRINILDHPFVSRIRKPSCQDGAPLFWIHFPDVVVRGWEVMNQTWKSTHFKALLQILDQFSFSGLICLMQLGHP